MTSSFKIISLILLFIYTSYVFRIIFPLLDYVINYSFIVHELCEQRDNPENMCMGKCYLEKEIQKTVEHEDEHAKLVLIDFENIPHNLTFNTIHYFPKIAKIFFQNNVLEKISPNIEPIIPPPKF